MANPKETAEQKLLKMIETSSGSAESKRTQSTVAKRQGSVSIIKTFNRLLIAGVFLAVVNFAYSLFSGMQLAGQTVHFSVDEASVQRSFDTGNLVPSAQKLSFYMSNIDKRNILEPFEAASSTNIVEVSSENQAIAQATQHLRLVGISWMKTIDSASVMLEDKSRNITHFLRKGEKLGNIQIKTIYADSVELGYENEEMIIRYDKSQM